MQNTHAPSLFWKIVGRVAFWGASLFGLCALIGTLEGSRLALLPVTPLEPLAQPIDLAAAMTSVREPPVRDGSRVRVEGFLRSDPPRIGQHGKRYALQKLRVTHIERRLVGGHSSSTRRTDLVSQSGGGESRLWLYVDEPEVSTERVEVRLPRLWDGEQLQITPIRGTVGDAGTIPNNVFAELALDRVQPEPGQEWELWSIQHNARVTAVATAKLEMGRVVLEVERGTGFALSPEPWAQITKGARQVALGQLALGVICLSPLAWKIGKRARRKRRSTSTWGASSV